MIIYLRNKETNEVINTFHNVINWGYDFVEYDNNGGRCKIYCDENEYFSNI